MRIDSALVPNFDHTPVLSGMGYANVHSYHAAHGGGWFSSLVSAVSPALKNAASSALSAGVQHLATGGNLHGALGAALGSAKSSALTSAQQAVGATGGGYQRARKRAHPF